MRRIVGTLVAGLVLATALAAAADKNAMQPGLWEYSVKMEMPGMPVTMPPQTSQQCLTQADVDKGNAGGDPAQRQGDCEIRNFKQSAGKVSYDVACSGAQPTTSHVETTSTPTSVQGTTTTDMGGQKMTTKMTGKRIGECKG